MTVREGLTVLLLGVVALFVLGPQAADARKERHATFDEVFGLGISPFAIGHRGTRRPPGRGVPVLATLEGRV
jgi:hypothetical protein